MYISKETHTLYKGDARAMNTQDFVRFGLEIETTAIKREQAAKIIAGHFGTEAIYTGGVYDTYEIKDRVSKVWKVVRDSSIKTVDKKGKPAGSEYSAEIVSPICTYNEDIDDIQEIVRKLKLAGARSGAEYNCGIHTHASSEGHTALTLRNLVNIFTSKEELLYKAVKVSNSRINYCKKTDEDFFERLNRNKPATLEQFKKLWYNGIDGSTQHYSQTRYIEA